MLARSSADKPGFAPSRSRPNFFRQIAPRNAASNAEADSRVFGRVPREVADAVLAGLGLVVGRWWIVPIALLLQRLAEQYLVFTGALRWYAPRVAVQDVRLFEVRLIERIRIGGA